MRYFVLTLFLVTLFATSVEASTLFGRVVEINDGDVITVFNLNRPVRIKLLAVDAPEAGQMFGDVAKKHLSDLVYDKSVLVEYSGIAADGSLMGRVVLDNTDIGAQMIRDGAAWFDANNQSRLSVADREIYQQSEQAARNERRGLWQAEAPVAPWEFVRAQTLRRDPVPSMNTVLPAAKARPARATSELTSLTLLASRIGPSSGPSTGSTSGPTAGSPADADKQAEELLWATEDDGRRKNWNTFKPEDADFSIQVPDDGQRRSISLPMGEKTSTVSIYAARDGEARYALMWISGPSFGESDKSALTNSAHAFLYGFAEGYKRRNNENFVCEPQGERPFTVNEFSGSDFDLRSCTIPGKLRMYTRSVNGERQMYIAVVFYNEPDANVSRFIKSFTIAGATAKGPASKQ
jgi:endonuclease YncB( thermonuclease family)